MQHDKPHLRPLRFWFTLALLVGSCGGGGGAGPASGTPGVFVDLSLSRLPLDHDFGQDAALGDLDNDGDLDLVVAASGQNLLLENLTVP